MAVDNASDEHDFEYDIDFAIEPHSMIQDEYYCIKDKKYYPVSKEMKPLISIGEGIFWMLKSKEAFYEGRLDEIRRAK